MDNVILTLEIIHSMNRKKGKKGFMVLKLDLHKAYDSLDRGFLGNTLHEKGFSERLINLIRLSLQESRISILWNGKKLLSFGVGRGFGKVTPWCPIFSSWPWSNSRMTFRKKSKRTIGSFLWSHVMAWVCLTCFLQTTSCSLVKPRKSKSKASWHAWRNFRNIEVWALTLPSP